MSRITRTALTKILRKAFLKTTMDMQQQNEVIHTIKIGKEAELHRGQKGVKAYFATEGTMITSYYYDAVKIFWEWEQEIQAGLAPLGLHMEMCNCCEFAIY